MFSVGDVVVYRHHVCEIKEIRKAYFEGRDYFELHTLFEKAMKLFVAIEDAVPPLMREPLNAAEAEQLIDSMKDAGLIDETIMGMNGATLSLAERQLKEEYDKHLKTNDAADLVPVMKSAYARTRERESAGRQSTAIDRKYFDLAEGLLCDELSYALNMEREGFSEYLAARIR